jgi:hypothetical protein
MKRAARWIVRHRLPLTAVLLALSAVCGLLSFQVPINADMTKYLPADSAMKQGMDVMEREFGSLSLPPTLRVMIENLPAEEEAGALEKLRAFPVAAAAVLSGRKREEGTSYTLFTVTLSAPYRTPEALETEHGIPGAFPGRRTTVRNDDANGMEIPLFIYAVAGAMLLAVLFTFCASWAEPFVFLAVLGAAILMNELGIETAGSFRNSAGYIQNWLTALRNDSRMIVSAAGKAEKAVKLIMNIEDQKEVPAAA